MTRSTLVLCSIALVGFGWSIQASSAAPRAMRAGMADGRAAPMAGGMTAPMAGGMAAPMAGTMDAPMAGTMAAPANGGMTTPGDTTAPPDGDPPGPDDVLQTDEHIYRPVLVEVRKIVWFDPAQDGLIEAHPLVMGLAAMALATVTLLFFFLRGVKRPRGEDL